MSLKPVLLLVCIFLYIQSLSGQCNLVRNISLLDNDTTLISILVDSLVSDTLGRNGQGLCGVGIEFRHEFIGDIHMDLISPSGQIIGLIGPGVPVSGSTTGTRWNVLFVPCITAASPDAGFTEVWDNLQPWGLFGNYTGQYYPINGCLEDFNLGPVNGNWTLRTTDVSQFGSGRILAVRLFFCDPEGVLCEECRLDPGNISSDPINICQSSSDFELQNYTETFPMFPKDTQTYFYKWALFSDTSLLTVFDQGSLPSTAVGNYQLCNIQYAKLEEDKLPQLPVLFNKEEINDFFEEESLCAKVGNQCISIEIFPSTDTLFLDTTICKGTSIEIFGNILSEAGSYQLQIPGVFCDTIVDVVLNTIDLGLNIFSDNDTIFCSNNTIFLTGNVLDTFLNQVFYQWSTLDGLILSNPDSNIIEIGRQGLYTLVGGNTTCNDTVDVVIFPDENLPEVLISGGNLLTCLTDTLVLEVVSDVPLSEILWTSGQPFVSDGDKIKVYLPGEYVVAITDTSGCKVTEMIEIDIIDTISPYSVNSENITCLRDTVNILIDHNVSGDYDYQWTGVTPGSESLNNPMVSSGGIKYVTITDVSTGCRDIDSVEIQDLRQFPLIEINVDTLTCGTLEIVPELISSLPLSEFLWLGPGINSTAMTVTISSTGDYTFTGTTEDGCSSMVSFTVELDTLGAILELSASELSCNADSVTISLNSDKELVAYIWTDPTNIVFSSMPEPKVGLTGLYTVTVTDIYGCTSAGSIDITGSLDLPNIEFETEPISCLNPLPQIRANKIQGYSFIWEFPDFSSSFDAEPVVTIPGRYKVTVTDTANPACVEYHELLIEDIRQFAVIQKDVGEITCSIDSSFILLSSDISLETIKISGPSFYLENDVDFYVKNLGTYFIEATTEDGCITTDSFNVILNDVNPEISVNVVNSISCVQTEALVVLSATLSGTDFEVYDGNMFLGSGSEILLNNPGNFIAYGIAPNNCRDTLLFQIEKDTIKPDLFVEAADTITCIRNEVFLTAASSVTGAIYTWNGQSGNPFSVAVGGDYTVVVTNPANGCQNTDTITVFESKIFAEYQVEDVEINCLQANITIVVEPENEYKNIRWSDSNPKIIDPGILTFETNQAGIYYFFIESSESCITIDSVIVADNTIPPQIVEIITPELDCNNRNVEISLTTNAQGDQVKWTTPLNVVLTGNRQMISEPGVYKIEITGSNGCKTDSITEVVLNLDLPEYSVYTDSLSCKKGKGIIGVNTTDSLIRYEWSGPSQFQSSEVSVLVTEAGFYTVIVTKANGCQDTSVVEVKGDYVLPGFSVRDSFFIPCDSSAIQLSTDNTDIIETYYWEHNGMVYSTDSMPFTNTPGKYTVRVTGLNGCRSVKEFEVIQVRLPAGFIFSTDTITCKHPVATLQAFSSQTDASYTWISPGGLISNQDEIETSESGEFTLIVQDDNKCLDTVSVVVPADTLKPDIGIGQQGQVICSQRQAVLFLPDSLQQDNTSYRWFGNMTQILSDPSQPTILIRDPGFFRLKITDEKNGCENELVYEVVEIQGEFDSIPFDLYQPVCSEFPFGTVILHNLNGAAPYEVVINNISFGNTEQFDMLSPGEYFMSVTDSLGCRNDTTFSVMAPAQLVIDLPVDTTILLGDSVVIDFDVEDWINNGYLISILENNMMICSSDCVFPLSIIPDRTSIYTILMETSDGKCSYEHQLFVNVNENIFDGIPNVMSNYAGNAENMYFYIPQKRGIEKVLLLEIYDKWASPMFARYHFQPGNYMDGWDGTFRGRYAEEGVYVVICDILMTNGDVARYRGTVTLLR